MIKYSGGFKRAAAFVLSVLMLLSQLALPLTALASEYLGMMPKVTLYYFVDGEPKHVKGEPGMYGDTMLYWLTVPQEAFEEPMGLVIDEGQLTCVSSNGENLEPVDAQSVSDMPATELQVYYNNQLTGSCPLYVSSMPMPDPEDEEDSWGDDNNWVNEEQPEQGGSNRPSWGRPDWGNQEEEEDTQPEQPEWNEPEQPEWNEPEQPEWNEPEQSEPQPAQIVINYADANGNVLFQESQTLYEGEHTISANAEAVRSYGYELEGGSRVSATVQVYADGSASRNPVTFTIRAVKQEEEKDEGTLVQTYECEGRTIKGNLRFRSSMSTSGDRNIAFQNIQTGTIVWVYSQLLNKNGEAWYSIRYNDVDCYVRADCLEVIDSSEPASAEVKFHYTDESGNELYPAYTDTFEEGTHDVSRYRYDAPEGYEYSYATADSVTVDKNGANPEYVAFIYKEVKPASAEVKFHYTDESGNELYPTYTDTLEEGTHDVSRYRYDAPEGYEYSYATADSVTVDKNGANPEYVAFIYKEVKPASAEVKFYYTDESGNELYPTYTDTLEEGTHDVSRYRYDAPEGYEYSYATADSITVDKNGANPEYVAFIYKEVKPASVEVKFHYTDESGNELYPTYTDTLEEGTH
ncbi:MAG: hypothetical protein PUD16_12295, partial [bacterium]|nr:hypothetical protein [bacterium]